MFARHGLLKYGGRTAALAAVAAMSISAVAPTGAIAAPAGKSPSQVSSQHGSSDVTDFSAARRRGHYYRRGGGNAAGLAAFGAIVGTIGAIAASQARRDYYYDRPGYYGGPGYYHGPAYYGGPGYGPGYYGGGPYY